MTMIRIQNSDRPRWENLLRDVMPESYRPVNQRQTRLDRPALNIRESTGGWEIELAVPGWRKEEFKINFEDSKLLISGQPEKPAEIRRNDYLQREFQPSAFARSLRLPAEEVDDNKISARYENGILYVSVARRKDKPGKRQIEVK